MKKNHAPGARFVSKTDWCVLQNNRTRKKQSAPTSKHADYISMPPPIFFFFFVRTIPRPNATYQTLSKPFVTPRNLNLDFEDWSFLCSTNQRRALGTSAPSPPLPPRPLDDPTRRRLVRGSAVVFFTPPPAASSLASACLVTTDVREQKKKHFPEIKHSNKEKHTQQKDQISPPTSHPRTTTSYTLHLQLLYHKRRHAC